MIVFVDDELFVLEFLRQGLTNYERPYSLCHSVEEAKSIIETSGQSIQMVVTDLHMPGEDGYDLIRWLFYNYPHIKKVILTAHSREHEIKEHIGSYKVDAILRKPIDVKTELLPILEMIL